MTAIWVSACLVAAVTAAGLGAACALVGLRMPGRTPVAAPAMVVMAVSCADMVLPDVRLLGPLAWAGLLVGSALLALLDRRHRGPAAHHAASLLLMAVMWAAMLSAASEPSGAAAGTDTPSSATSVGSADAAAISAPRIGTAADAEATTAAAADEATDTGVGTAGTDVGTTGTDAGTAATGAGTNPETIPGITAGGSGAHAGHGAAFTDGGTLLAGLVGLVVAASAALAAGAVRSARRPAGRGVALAMLRLESAQHLSMAVAMTLMAAGMFLPLAGAGAP